MSKNKVEFFLVKSKNNKNNKGGYKKEKENSFCGKSQYGGYVCLLQNTHHKTNMGSNRISILDIRGP